MEKIYAIAILCNVYQPDIQGLGAVHMDSDDQQNIIWYTLAEARARIEEMDAEVYVTTNGEAGRPNYVILDDNDANYLASGRNGDGGNYDWTNCDCTLGDDGEACGSCNTCIAAMIDEDRQYAIDNAII